jgi:hypothetical protein
MTDREAQGGYCLLCHKPRVKSGYRLWNCPMGCPSQQREISESLQTEWTAPAVAKRLLEVEPIRR